MPTINDLTATTGLPRWTADIVRSWTVVSNPTVEPISLELARSHLRLHAYGSPLSHPDDFWITEVGLPAARQYCERFIGRACAVQTLEMQLSRFPGADDGDGGAGVEMFMAPVASIESVSYLDSSGGETALSSSDYFLAPGDPPSIYLSSGATWPGTFAAPGVVRVRYVAGYSPIGASPLITPEIPQGIKIAILLMLAHMYENREAAAGDTADSTVAHELPLGVVSILTPYRLRLSMA